MIKCAWLFWRKSNQDCTNHYFIIIIHESNQTKCWFLMRGENRGTRGKTCHGRVENQQTQSTYDTECVNRTRATLVVGKCSHNLANPATNHYSYYNKLLLYYFRDHFERYKQAFNKRLNLHWVSASKKTSFLSSFEAQTKPKDLTYDLCCWSMKVMYLNCGFKRSLRCAILTVTVTLLQCCNVESLEK